MPSKTEIGTLVAVSATIISGAVWLGNLNGRVSTLERDIQELKQDLKNVRNYGSSSEGGQKEPISVQRRASELNVDETEKFSNLRLSSPIKVKWNLQRNMVVQVYKDGKPIYDEEHSSGGAIIDLKPARYEVKLWIPGASSQHKNVWIEVTE